MKLKATLYALPLIAASAVLSGPEVANAVTLSMSSIGDSLVFAGGTFTFEGGTPSFDIESSDAVSPNSVGKTGAISGAYAIGDITSSELPGLGTLQTATVTGNPSGTLTLYGNGGVNLTANITFDDIYTLGTGGAIEAGGTANVTNITYTCTNDCLSDYVALAAAPVASQTISFQFNPAVTLTTLKSATSEESLATSYSGTLTAAVPIPAAAWLFGCGLAGIVAVARRRDNSDVALRR